MAALLAVDVGLRAGLACYGDDGLLRWYRSRHFSNRTSLRQGVRALLADEPVPAWLVLEGGGPLADIWLHAAAKQGIQVRQVAAETWREALLYPREQRTGRDAKLTADTLARRVIELSGAKRPTSLRHDAAEAILLGLWAVRDLGWLADWPDALRS